MYVYSFSLREWKKQNRNINKENVDLSANLRTEQKFNQLIKNIFKDLKQLLRALYGA